MTKSMQLGDVPSITNPRKRVRAKRRPAKATMWRGWGVLFGGILNTHDEVIARELAANEGAKLVRVTAKLTPVKP